MALNATQLTTVAEITQETFATVESLATSLETEQETSIIADIATWNENRNDVDVRMAGEINYRAQWLLNEIRKRVRKHLGLPLVSPEESGYSMSVPHTWIY